MSNIEHRMVKLVFFEIGCSVFIIRDSKIPNVEYRTPNNEVMVISIKLRHVTPKSEIPNPTSEIYLVVSPPI